MNSLFQMLANTADGAFVIQSDQRISYWNQSAQQILGYTSEQVVGCLCYDVLKGYNDKSQLVCCRSCPVAVRSFAGKTVPNYNLAIRTISGDMRWVNISILATPLSKDHSSLQLVHLFRDVTKIKRNEQFVHNMFDTPSKQKNVRDRTFTTSSNESPIKLLTSREREILSFLVQGYGTSAIAKSLSISITTVRNHTQSILHKLQVHSRLEAVVYAFKLGYIQ